MASFTPAQLAELEHPQSFLETLGVSSGVNNTIQEGTAIASGGVALGAVGAGAAAAGDAAEAETAGTTAAETSLKDEDAAAAKDEEKNGTGGNALTKAAAAAGLSGLLAALWSPLRVVELLIGLVLLFMGIHTLTGVGPSAGIAKAAVA